MTWDLIELFIAKPHVFGHYLGFTDLIEIHSKWIKDAWTNKNKKAMQAHRNSYKTTSILIVGAIWQLLFINPSTTILIIRKSDADAQKIVETIRQFLESKEILYITKFLYNTTNLETANWSKKSLTISLKQTKTPEGSIDAKGTTSAITGAHYDFIFPDDIITLKDRVSKAEREWIKDFVRELRNIIKEGGDIFFSGTPWHKKDAWEIIPKPDIYPIGSVPIKGFTPDILKKKIKELRAGTTQSLYCANYDLKHIDDTEKIFVEPRRAKWPEKIFNPFVWLDPAYMGENTNALTILAQSGDDNNYKGEWFARGWVWTENVVDIYNQIVDKLTSYAPGATLWVESNADKGLSVKDLRVLYPNCEPKHEKTNKHIKIVGYAKQHWHKIIFADDCDLVYLNQILDYTEGEEPDDAPDSFASCVRQAGFAGHDMQETPQFERHQILGW